MPSQLTTKQQRDQRRSEKVAILKRQQARQKRNRVIGISVGSVAVVVVIALIVTFVVTSSSAKPVKDGVASSQITGLRLFKNLPANHVDPTPVDYKALYGMDPPAGGNHWAEWLNCGVYDQPQQNERAVHDMEHGAVWITYDPSKVTEAQVTAMVAKLPSTYLTVSPYPNLPAPVVASAWGAQVKLKNTTDARIASFVKLFWRSADAPEPTSPCTGGFNGPGKVS
jgi:hypothetical protein